MTARGSAIRYARALFDVALQERVDLDVLQRELSGFVALVTGHETLSRALMTPTVPATKKRAVVEALFARGGAVSPLLGKILTLLAERDRLTLLPELAAAFERRLMDHRQVVRASLATAVALPPDRIAALEGRPGPGDRARRPARDHRRSDAGRRGRGPDRQHGVRRQRHHRSWRS